MITTSTGAKKLESSDNWREIFPNPGTSAAGAHNASVDAHDRIQAEVAPIINGKRCSLGAASGEYVLLRNSTITGKADGAYQAAKAIPANTDLDSTYLGSPITGGLVNELNNNLTANTSKTSYVSVKNCTSIREIYNTLKASPNGIGRCSLGTSDSGAVKDVLGSPFPALYIGCTLYLMNALPVFGGSICCVAFNHLGYEVKVKFLGITEQNAYEGQTNWM